MNGITSAVWASTIAGILPDRSMLIPAVQVGAFFGMLALGMLFVREGAGFFNFAIGPYAMFAGLGSSWMVAQWGMNPWIAVVCGTLFAAALSAMTEVVVVRPVWKRSGHSEQSTLIALVAVLFALQQIAGTIFGQRPLRGPQLLSIEPIRVGGLNITGPTVSIVVAALMVFLLAWSWLRFTRQGRMLKAIGDNPAAASVLGLPVDRVRTISFLVGGLIAGVAGVVIAGRSGASFRNGLDYTLFGFLALVIGGTGSIWAPLVGGLLLSATQTMATFWFGSSSLDYATLIAAAAFFALRPEGVFRKRVRV